MKIGPILAFKDDEVEFFLKFIISRVRRTWTLK